MTLALNSTTKNEFYAVVEKINQIIDALGEFEGKFDKKFNLSKLAQYLSLNEIELDSLTNIILKMQEKFEIVFKNHRIIKKVIKTQTYFTLERKEREIIIEDIKIPDEIHIAKTHLNQLCDIIYLFQYIQKGKGFNLGTNNTELLTNLNKLQKKHPYFFMSNSNNVVYPSELGLALGNLIRSYNKSNKEVKSIEINKHIIIID